VIKLNEFSSFGEALNKVILLLAIAARLTELTCRHGGIIAQHLSCRAGGYQDDNVYVDEIIVKS
jgi:hypothetical protein